MKRVTVREPRTKFFYNDAKSQTPGDMTTAGVKCGSESAGVIWGGGWQRSEVRNSHLASKNAELKATLQRMEIEKSAWLEQLSEVRGTPGALNT